MGVRACEKNKRKVMKSLRRDNKSKITGVSFNNSSKRWIAQIGIDGENKYLGSFTSFSDAVDVRKLAEVAYGYHVNHGEDM